MLLAAEVYSSVCWCCQGLVVLITSSRADSVMFRFRKLCIQTGARAWRSTNFRCCSGASESSSIQYRTELVTYDYLGSTGTLSTGSHGDAGDTAYTILYKGSAIFLHGVTRVTVGPVHAARSRVSRTDLPFKLVKGWLRTEDISFPHCILVSTPCLATRVGPGRDAVCAQVPQPNNGVFSRIPVKVSSFLKNTINIELKYCSISWKNDYSAFCKIFTHWLHELGLKLWIHQTWS